METQYSVPFRMHEKQQDDSGQFSWTGYVLRTTYTSSVNLSTCDCEQSLRGVYEQWPLMTVTVCMSVTDTALLACTAATPWLTSHYAFLLQAEFGLWNSRIWYYAGAFITLLYYNLLSPSFLCRWLYCVWRKIMVAFVWRYWYNKERDMVFNLE